jgi:hypothetical protein
VQPATLTAAVHRIFLGQVVVAALMIVMVALMPRGDRPEAEPAALDRASAEPAVLDRASAEPATLDRTSAAEGE